MMELPQQRPFGTDGRKPTHDFLSLYSHSSVQQDPRPPSQGVYLKTHDFLQPLERAGNTAAKEEINEDVSTLEKPPPPAPPSSSAEHVLPGGIGTYSISHISYFNHRVPKPEGSIFSVAQASSTDKNEEHSNCSSYTGSGFALWGESELKKGKTGKENLGERPNTAREAASRAGQWASSERPSQSSSNNHRNSFSSLSSSQPSGQKNQSFMEMIKSAKGSTLDDELEDEEEFFLKKESTSPIHKGELRIKVDGKNTDQKANTPRSKHSATEQRRRSKINDRFQMLRQLIPHGDQKRDKASFLLEVIEYIQFLQEKVQKYECSYQGWNHEPAKLVPWRNNQSPGLNSSANAALLLAAKLDEKNIAVSPTIHGSAQTPVESDMSSAAPFKGMEHHPGNINKAMPFPVSPLPFQPNFFNHGRASGAGAQLIPRLTSDAENLASLPQHQSCPRSCSADGAAASDKLKQQELTVDGGTINISSVYSQGLLNTLTKALQSSGVDLSQASMSVQIELGKRMNAKPITPTSITKDKEIPSSNQGTTRNRSSSQEEPDQAMKKLKSSKT